MGEIMRNSGIGCFRVVGYYQNTVLKQEFGFRMSVSEPGDPRVPSGTER